MRSRCYFSKQLLANLLLLLISYTSVGCYTVKELQTLCEPCDFADLDKIIHPTDCTSYFYCNVDRKWTAQICPSSTYFVQEEQVCINPAAIDGVQCDYDLGINESLDKDIYSLRQCSGYAPTTINTNTAANNGTVSDKPGATTDFVAITTTEAKQKPSLTVVLGVLLGVTFLLLIVVVVGILLYRKKQNDRRPKYFYTRESPSSNPNGTNLRMEVPAAAGNAAYLSRSLLKSKRDERVESVDYEVPMSDAAMSEEPYTEIPERSSKAYYSDPAESFRPGMPLPVITTTASPDSDNLIYSEAMTPDGDNEKGTDGYMHPTRAQDNHIYRAKTTDDPNYVDAELEDPYDYCQPEIANPTLSFRRGPEPPPATSPSSPETPPYYMDPIPDLATAPNSAYPYHTLEPLGKQ